MKNKRFSHLGDVFNFTLRQQTNGKGFVIMTFIIPILLFTIFFAINTLLAVFNKDNVIDYQCKTAYIIDQTETGMVADVLSGVFAEDDDLGKIEIIKSDKKDAKEVCEAIGENDKTGLVLTVTYDREKNSIDIIETIPDWSDITKDEYEAILNKATQSMLMFKIVTSGIQAEIVAYLQSGVMSEVRAAGEASEDSAEFLIKMLVPMLSVLIIFMILMIYGQSTGKVVAVEKNSKLMEYMLTLIHPDALITGKVLAISILSIAQVLLWVVGGVLGYVAGELIGKSIAPDYVNVIGQVIKEFAEQTASAFTPLSIVMAVITVIAGFIFYGFIAGLFGSLVGKPEELANTMGLYNLIVMVGYFGSYFAMMGSDESLKNIIRIVPFTSAFSLASEIAIGSAGYTIGGIGMAVLIVSCIVMAVICGKVYKAKIFNKGKGAPAWLKVFR